MTCAASLYHERRAQMDNLTPETQGGLYGAVITAVVALAGIWVKGRFAERSDERSTLLEAFRTSQARVRDLEMRMATLENHLNDANTLINSLVAQQDELEEQLTQAATEREELRNELAAHRARCPEGAA
jgi:peptidoglycan hydrolase CwlO-like protein